MDLSKLMSPRGWVAVALFPAAAVLLLLVDSCANVERTVIVPLHIEGATYVGNQACFDCHPNITRSFPASPHARLHLEKEQMGGQGGCESCHGPGSKHIAMGGRGGLDKFIINPGKDPEACFQCHLETRAQFHFPEHHPVLEGRMNCVQCHDPHGQDSMKPESLLIARRDDTCAQCHREQAKPMIFQHPAMREGCTSCHNPHGSVNPKLLTVRDSNLCLRCHAQVQGPATGGVGHLFIGNKDHTTFLRYGTCWTAGCHTAVHGSSTQPYLLY